MIIVKDNLPESQSVISEFYFWTPYINSTYVNVCPIAANISYAHMCTWAPAFLDISGVYEDEKV